MMKTLEIYYSEIEEFISIQKICDTLFKEFAGLNSYGVPQKHDSRRFIYTDDSCISMIHALWRNNKLNVSATLRSSRLV